MKIKNLSNHVHYFLQAANKERNKNLVNLASLGRLFCMLALVLVPWATYAETCQKLIASDGSPGKVCIQPLESDLGATVMSNPSVFSNESETLPTLGQ